jgi:hypothetical protein
VQIIKKSSSSEGERRKREDSVAILRHYYNRECRDGTRMKLVAPKSVIKKLYEGR